ncbi:ThiF family adenylyltransferase [Sedimentibacter hydroxybenzoicus DSM 7310]|uniref:ThiF family adenylyltransferase n=1 Tax=Sedimentibacter hydroxybenzoicus DSM 7310 TaxID=1123245 RepID=A0A974BKI8_SEDHY|nr:ThiF family adenylyltransferase [Sedimentibacter hydroxybenzoicus]NYB74772.1 ThiF family adenylyltransferase [Sedimentibacter hydroxybenzoicus DSM 7310]
MGIIVDNSNMEENYINKSKIIIEGKYVLRIKNVHELSEMLNKSIRQTELYLLEQNILPYRYIGTARFIGLSGIEKLLKSRVAIIGCGGVGGYIGELCARLGVGEILLFDGDVFEESNINRQIGCLEKNIGKHKAEIIADRIKDINSATEVSYKNIFLHNDQFIEEFSNSDIVIDAVDNIQDRLDIAKACMELMIPFIHGSIGNSSVHVGVATPDNNFLEEIYSHKHTNNMLLGNPAPTAILCAALQVCELVKIICGIGDVLSGSLLHYNWLSNDLVTFDITNK